MYVYIYPGRETSAGGRRGKFSSSSPHQGSDSPGGNHEHTLGGVSGGEGGRGGGKRSLFGRPGERGRGVGGGEGGEEVGDDDGGAGVEAACKVLDACMYPPPQTYEAACKVLDASGTRSSGMPMLVGLFWLCIRSLL
jgi:hypothetical protein